ncbi:MAG: lipocalin family protein [Flavobacteriaceae bacterium]
MKKIIAITFILLSSLQTIVGQEKNKLELITSGKWYLESIENDGHKKTFQTELKESNWMLFHSDGKHEVMSFGELNFGKWEYSKDQKTVKMTNGGRTSNQEVMTLNDKKLILRIKAEEIEILMKFKK